MRSTTAMMLAPGWRWMLTMTAGVAVHPGGLHRVLGAVDDIALHRHAHRRAVAISDDEWLVVRGGQQLIVGVDL